MSPEGREMRKRTRDTFYTGLLQQGPGTPPHVLQTWASQRHSQAVHHVIYVEFVGTQRCEPVSPAAAMFPQVLYTGMRPFTDADLENNDVG